MKSIATFDIQYHQYLDENAKVVCDLPQFAEDHDHLIRLYRSMNLVRTLDAKAVILQRQGKMGTYPSSLGTESVSIALGDVMNDEDVFCPYYRDTGAMIERGVKPSKILAYWGGDERGSDFQGPREDFPISVPIATQCLHAAGVAFAIKYKKQKRAVATSIGDGGTSEGEFYEAINLAGAWNLPILFVINNNQWAISVPRKFQTAAQTIAQKAIAAGIEGIQVDGNDVIACREVMDYAMKKARSGDGPTLIEAVTYRLADHTTADDASRYWDKKEVDAAWKIEPVARLKKYLIEQKVWSEEKEKALLQELKDEVASAVDEFINAPSQPVSSIMDYMYAELPEALLDQREALLENNQGGAHG